MARGLALAISAKDFKEVTGYDNTVLGAECQEMLRGGGLINTDGEFHSLADFEPLMTDRHFCEDNPDYLQLIPYITYWRTNTRGQKEILTYQRGGASGEARLISKYSIGIGGHIEIMPDYPMTDLIDVLMETAIRETEEELGTGIYSSVSSKMVLKGEVEKQVHVGVLYACNFSNVDQVHLAVLISICLDKLDSDNITPEKGTINNQRWLPVDQLQEIAKVQRQDPTTSIQLENWSLKAVEVFCDDPLALDDASENTSMRSLERV